MLVKNASDINAFWGVEGQGVFGVKGRYLESAGVSGAYGVEERGHKCLGRKIFREWHLSILHLVYTNLYPNKELLV
jgi:hypothetical protein